MSHVDYALSAASAAAPLWRQVILLSLVLLAPSASAQQFEFDKLLASDGAVDAFFGSSIALCGERSLIGARHDDDNGPESGSAYVYRYYSTGAKWWEEAKLVPSDGSMNDHFGGSVALDDDRVLVSSIYDDDNGKDSGAAYIFRYDSASGTWLEEAKLLASDGEAGDHLGTSVALSGERALIGAFGDDDNGLDSGSAYIFRYDGVSGTWLEEAKLLPSDGTESERFGNSVALCGDRALIGSYRDGHNGPLSGSAYLFRYDSASELWYEEAKLLPADGDLSDYFGCTVALHGQRALIGSYGNRNNGYSSGSAYLFRYDSGSDSWQEEAKLLASDGASYDFFGTSVSLFEESALVGAYKNDDMDKNSGSAYLFRYDSVSGNWFEEAKLLATDGAENDLFGVSGSIFGDKILIGARGDDDNGDDSGSVYAYDLTRVLDLDIKCNGQDQNVFINSGEKVTLTIDIENGYHPDLKGDFWVLAMNPYSTWSVWTFGPRKFPMWKLGWANVYHSGPPANHSATVFDCPAPPPGNYRAILALDDIPDGFLNLTALIDSDVVDFVVQ